MVKQEECRKDKGQGRKRIVALKAAMCSTSQEESVRPGMKLILVALNNPKWGSNRVSG
ncbi:MAG: hypothetical protein JW836_02365 [Deltaproteobacteria bacterium]|nr:hypothetical protein [Deltaproteobacteria bacterium]